MSEGVSPAQASFRLATPEDSEQIAAIYRPMVEESIVSFEETAPTSDEVAERISRTLQNHPWLVAADGKRVLAYAYASRHRDRAAYRWAVDVSVYAHPTAKRRGFGRTLYSILFGLLELQNYQVAYAGIALPNEASVGFHESMGFRPLGLYRQVGFKFGAWHDVGWWSRDLGNRPNPPREPLSVRQCSELPEWREVLATAGGLG